MTSPQSSRAVANRRLRVAWKPYPQGVARFSTWRQPIPRWLLYAWFSIWMVVVGFDILWLVGVFLVPSIAPSMEFFSPVYWRFFWAWITWGSLAAHVWAITALVSSFLMMVFPPRPTSPH